MTTKLRGGCIGFGFIASQGHAPTYLRRANNPGDFEIVAIADACEARRVEARRQFPQAKIYQSWEALIGQEGDALDFVDICVPPYLHSAIAVRALSRGLNVLCEKPMAATTAQALSMVETAAKSRRVLFPCHNYRHAPVVKTVRELLANGVIGDVHLATLQTFRPTHARGVAEWRPDWRRERHYSGGGIAMDHGSHTFYLTFEWMRSYPISITAKVSTLGDFDTEDNFSCTLTFPTGIAVAHLTWTAGARRVLYTLHGQNGTIIVEDDDVRLLGNTATRGDSMKGMASLMTAPSQWMDASHKEWFSSLLDDFRAAIDTNQWVARDTLDALTCVDTIQTGYASAGRESREMAVSGPRLLNRAPNRNLPKSTPTVAEVRHE